jgi:hypothetical protein
MYKDFAIIPCPIVVLLLRASARGVMLLYYRHNCEKKSTRNVKLQYNHEYFPAEYFFYVA